MPGPADHREQAKRCRRLCQNLCDRTTVDRLTELADELEARADAEDAAALEAARHQPHA